MSEQSQAIKDYARKECIYGMSTVEHIHGKAVAGIVVEGNLEAIALYLTGSIGAEAAFNVLTRHADEIIRSTINAQDDACPGEMLSICASPDRGRRHRSVLR
jgi:hypothetical protein